MNGLTIYVFELIALLKQQIRKTLFSARYVVFFNKIRKLLQRSCFNLFFLFPNWIITHFLGNEKVKAEQKPTSPLQPFSSFLWQFAVSLSLEKN
jgi:hypothetical protein